MNKSLILVFIMTVSFTYFFELFENPKCIVGVFSVTFSGISSTIKISPSATVVLSIFQVKTRNEIEK